jgi:Sec-independent protein translocase protein TatA
MGFEISIPQLVLLIVIVAWIFGTKRLDGVTAQSWSTLKNELRSRLPIYSAETTRGQEAEFIRDRLPKRITKLIVVGIVAFGAIAWWLTR